MSEELKPCPFCGGKAICRNPNNFYWGKIVICEICGVQIQPVKNEEEAIAAWNKRAGREAGL